MPAKDSAKILEEFMTLAAKEIDVIAKRVKFEPAAQATAVEMLHGLSAAAKKSISDFAKTIQNLPKKDRETLLSALEKSGAVNTANLLTPLLRMGDATDPCFLLHESAKQLYSMSTIVEITAAIIEPVKPTSLPYHFLAQVLEVLALNYDIAAQACDQSAAELAEANLALMEAAVIRLEQKIDYIMDLRRFRQFHQALNQSP